MALGIYAGAGVTAESHVIVDYATLQYTAPPSIEYMDIIDV